MAMNDFKIENEGNLVTVADNVQLSGWIRGTGNEVLIEAPAHECRLDLCISGDNNLVIIRKPFAIKGLQVRIGNHVRANRTVLKIDEGFSIEGNGQFLLYNSGNRLEIGSQCMFSNNITVRCGDSPHLLFDLVTGEYLDTSEGVFIGNHVWIGERVYITKRATAPDECVVAACSVLSRRFEEPNCVLAGNPAKVVRKGVQWVRNYSYLDKNSAMFGSYSERLKMHQ